MGRTEQSRGLAPPAIRKDIRAKQARHIINKVIPAILTSNARSRNGVDASALIVDPPPLSVQQAQSTQIDNGKWKGKGKIVGTSTVSEDEGPAYVKRKGQGKRKAKGGIAGDDIVAREGRDTEERGATGKAKGRKRKDSPIEGQFEKLSITDASSSSVLTAQGISTTEDISKPGPPNIRIITTDTLTAAHMLTFPIDYGAHPHKRKDKTNTFILNMASPLRPGGGVLSGATSQEEYLCTRTTLLPSLREEFYRLPELGAICTPDVLVFRSPGPLDSPAHEIPSSERYYVDVLSAGMLRFPDLVGKPWQKKRLGKEDKDMVERKMRAVLRIACLKGAKRIVLGAWGCGAYGNPVGDIARAWRRVLESGYQNSIGKDTSRKKGKGTDDKETWDSLEEVIFAIPNRKMAEEFAAEGWVGEIEVEKGPGAHADEDEEEEEEDSIAEELRTKIKEMEEQVAHVWNPDLKTRMGLILDELKAQLAEREGDVRNGSDFEDASDLDEKELGDVEKLESSFSHSEGIDEEADEDAAYEQEDRRQSIGSTDGRGRALWC